MHRTSTILKENELLIIRFILTIALQVQSTDPIIPVTQMEELKYKANKGSIKAISSGSKVPRNQVCLLLDFSFSLGRKSRCSFYVQAPSEPQHTFSRLCAERSLAVTVDLTVCEVSQAEFSHSMVE